MKPDPQEPEGSSRSKRPKKTTKTTRVKKQTLNKDKVSIENKKDVPAFVHDAIKQAFLRYYDKVELKQSQNYDLTHIDNILSEYLDNFILLGFDTLGAKVTLTHSSSHCGKDALIEHVRSTLIQMIGPEHQ
jgi:hypothetical protein